LNFIYYPLNYKEGRKDKEKENRKGKEREKKGKRKGKEREKYINKILKKGVVLKNTEKLGVHEFYAAAC
jgi:hypothetical protein